MDNANKLQNLIQTIEQFEESLDALRQQADSIMALQELKHKSTLNKSVLKLQIINEEKAVEIDKLTSKVEANSQERDELKKQVEELNQQLSGLHQIEEEYKGLKSEYNVDKQTLATLQQDLINEKMEQLKWKSQFEKLGLVIEQLENTDLVFDQLLSNPELLKEVKEKLAENDLVTNTTYLSNAELEVKIKMLETQITSLKAEQLAQQQANSQLAGEKDEVTKELEKYKDNHEKLLKEQQSLQKLNELLASNNIDGLLESLQATKNSINDLRTDNRDLIDEIVTLNCLQQTLEGKIETLSLESKLLNALKEEHSRLMDDFKLLFAANEKLREDYRMVLNEYMLLRTNNQKLKLSLIELEVQTASTKDETTSPEHKKTKLKNNDEEPLIAQNNGGAGPGGQEDSSAAEIPADPSID